VDSQGNRRTLDDLYPWPFRPAALGVPGDDPATVRWSSLAIAADAAPPDVAGLLLDLGGRAHVPYSEAPSAVVLRLADGRLLGAAAVESVAFNPSISATQAALVELAAVRGDAAAIVEAWLARVRGARVDPEAGFRALITAAAPTASVRTVDWLP
jgi:cytidine deaminase